MPHFRMQADFFRYAVVYLYGGVYLDSDIACRPGEPHREGTAHPGGPSTLPLDLLLDMHPHLSLVVGYEQQYPTPALAYAKHYARQVQLLQWAFAAAPGHPAFLELLTRIAAGGSPASTPPTPTAALTSSERTTRTTPTRRSTKGPSSRHLEVLNRTGPGIFTDVMWEYVPPRVSKDLRLAWPASVLPMVALGNKPGGRGPMRPKEEGELVVHYSNGSWKHWDLSHLWTKRTKRKGSTAFTSDPREIRDKILEKTAGIKSPSSSSSSSSLSWSSSSSMSYEAAPTFLPLWWDARGETGGTFPSLSVLLRRMGVDATTRWDGVDLSYRMFVHGDPSSNPVIPAATTPSLTTSTSRITTTTTTTTTTSLRPPRPLHALMSFLPARATISGGRPRDARFSKPWTSSAEFLVVDANQVGDLGLLALTGVAMGIDVVAFRPTPSAVAELTDALEGQRVDREAIDLYHHLRRTERAHGVQTKVGDDDDDDQEPGTRTTTTTTTTTKIKVHEGVLADTSSWSCPLTTRPWSRGTAPVVDDGDDEESFGMNATSAGESSDDVPVSSKISNKSFTPIRAKTSSSEEEEVECSLRRQVALDDVLSGIHGPSGPWVLHLRIGGIDVSSLVGGRTVFATHPPRATLIEWYPDLTEGEHGDEREHVEHGEEEVRQESSFLARVVSELHADAGRVYIHGPWCSAQMEVEGKKGGKEGSHYYCRMPAGSPRLSNPPAKPSPDHHTPNTPNYVLIVHPSSNTHDEISSADLDAHSVFLP